MTSTDVVPVMPAYVPLIVRVPAVGKVMSDDVVTGASVHYGSAGSRTITGTYAGKAGTASVAVGPVPTTSAVMMSGVLVEGRTFHFDVTVDASTATGTPPTPEGAVQLQIDGVNVGAPVPLSGRLASVPWAAPTVGAHTAKIVYIPNPGDWLTSSDTVPVIVLTVAAPTASLRVSATSADRSSATPSHSLTTRR